MFSRDPARQDAYLGGHGAHQGPERCQVESCTPARNLGVDFPAIPFRPEHLAQAVTALAQLADAVLKDIRAPGDEATGTVVN